MAEELPKEPVGAEQTYLAKIAGQDVELPKEPIGPEQAYLNYIAKHGGGGGGGTNDYDDLFNQPKINNVTLSGNKTSSNLSLQDKLVSGTNIKTINNTSILGSGNIDIQGGDTSELYQIVRVMKNLLKKAVYTVIVTSDLMTLDDLLPDGVSQRGSVVTVRSQVTVTQTENDLSID